MLKRIIFLLLYTKDEFIQEQQNLILCELQNHSIEVSFLISEEFALPEYQKLVQAEIPTVGTETLYVTDSSELLGYIMKLGGLVLAYWHPYNQTQNLSPARYAIEDITQLSYETYLQAYLRLTGQPWTILETPRLLVRETTLDDIDSFYEIYKEPSITRYMENLFSNREEEVTYIRTYIETVYAFYGYGVWTVLDKKTGRIIGRAGISHREGYDIPELGFVIARDMQRQGYAFEVCQAILQYAKEELEFEQIQAFVEPANTASIRLCEKLGFKERGSVTEKGKVLSLFILS